MRITFSSLTEDSKFLLRLLYGFFFSFETRYCGLRTVYELRKIFLLHGITLIKIDLNCNFFSCSVDGAVVISVPSSSKVTETLHKIGKWRMKFSSRRVRCVKHCSRFLFFFWPTFILLKLKIYFKTDNCYLREQQPIGFLSV